ncbi:MAG TPA: redoxin domain-containing protein [Leptolyngbyaceae cyanobacterium M65_K2018_010]|nr:redoxin domain-containing protein [Leptolyngbyaceae cyanobacterium M65_K2018_010]
MTAASSTPLAASFWRYLLPRPAYLGLPLGAIPPDFALWDVTHQRTVRLANWRSKGPVVLAFTRIFAAGVYCPFCYPHLVAMNQAYPQFRNGGAEVLLIASLHPRQGEGVVEDLQLTLPLLCDPEGTSFRRYFTGQALGAPLPAQFVLNAQGQLCYAHLFSFLHPNAEPTTLLAVVETL